MEDLNAKIGEINKLKGLTLDFVREYIENKDLPLEDRWNIFTTAGEDGILEHKDFIEHFKGEVEEWSDEEYLDGERVRKFETVTAQDMIDSATDDEKSEEFINDLKEQWMGKMIWSFKFDW